MKLLVDITTGEILAEHHTSKKKNGSVVRWSGRAGELQDQGKAKWLDIPEDCAREDVIVVLQPTPTIQQDIAKRTQREAELAEKAAAREARRELMRTFDFDAAPPTIPPAFRGLLQAIVAELLDR